MNCKFPDKYLDDYILLGRFRGFQQAIANKYSEQMMRCPVHLSIGQEYWLAPIRRLFYPRDRCFSSHRSHSMYMALGGDFEKLIAELHGHENGCLGGIGGSMHVKDRKAGLEQSVPIVGSSLGLALGSALAAQKKNENILTLAYFGDGACEEGIVHESLNMSKVLSLPLLFICENNTYSCNTHIRRRQASTKMTRFAQAHEISNDYIDQGMGYDLLVQKITDAFTIARNKPFFLEIFSYRLYEHCGNALDKNKGDRTESEYNSHLKNDHISILQNEYDVVQKSQEHALKYYSSLIEKYSSLNREFIYK